MFAFHDDEDRAPDATQDREADRLRRPLTGSARGNKGTEALDAGVEDVWRIEIERRMVELDSGTAPTVP